LNSEEKYEEALKQVEDAFENIDDTRLTAKKKEYEDGKAAITKISDEAFKAAQNALSAKNLERGDSDFAKGFREAFEPERPVWSGK